jgi:hypothetical protein
MEAWLAGGYAVFLAGVATVLERVARHAHRRSQALATTGFIYNRALDVWICPTGQHLHRTHSGHELKVLRYRAEARLCNECAVKRHCTDSNQCRLIEQYPDSWLQSSLRQFHRGLSLALLTLALLLLVIEVFRQSGSPAQGSMAVLAVAVGAMGIRAMVQLGFASGR